MRDFNQFCRKGMAAAVLVLMLACSTLAGEIPYPGVTAPPPVVTDGDVPLSNTSSPTETADGDVQFPGVAVDSVTGLALTLWQSATALF